MSVDIWAAASGTDRIAPLGGRLLRLVESQEQVASNRLVDTLEEQALLETLLEAAKPPMPAAARGLHYLLATPFRYPPLRHGSRFGGRFEPSLFYAAKTLRPVLAEAAYYRVLFWSGMAIAPAGPLTTQHSLFGARWRCRRGVRLHAPPFDAWSAVLTDPADYAATQQVGSAMRQAGIEAFEYRSARDRDGGINVALFTPTAFVGKRPDYVQSWLCETNESGVRFYSVEVGEVSAFGLEQFLVEGKLPAPAL